MERHDALMALARVIFVGDKPSKKPAPAKPPVRKAPKRMPPMRGCA